MEGSTGDERIAESQRAEVSEDQQMAIEEVYALAKQCRQEKDYMTEAYWYEMLLMYRNIDKEWLEFPSSSAAFLPR